MAYHRRIEVIDSHTGGEPTRVVVSGGPDLGSGSMAERREVLRTKFDAFRSSVVNEPRGSEALVGAILCRPIHPESAVGVIFFNNVGVLNMCGHGMIGLAVTLGYLGRLEAGQHTIETPVGDVEIDFDGGNGVTIQNVPSYRFRKAVTLNVEGFGPLTGDVAWGGNWFFLVNDHGQDLDRANIESLTEFTWRIRQSLERERITGANGEIIDHIELFGPPRDLKNHSRNFVLCPGKAYDRSPCGTGTSAKIACLLADGKIKPEEIWRQESILGSVFEASGRIEGDKVIPQIAGFAYITSQATLIVDDSDPFAHGILT